MKPRHTAATATAFILAAATAHAHPGHDHVHGLAHGFAHPFFGLDHLLAMIAVGLWAAQRGGRALWAMPCVFVFSMAFGGVIGMAGMPIAPVESVVVLSVLILGWMVAQTSRLPLTASLAMISLFAVMHGYAHGAELSAGDGPMSYAAGFLAATTLLQTISIVCSTALKQFSATRWIQFGGGAIAASGLAMLLGVI